MHGGAQRRNYAGIATGSGSPPVSGCYRCGSPPAQLVAPGSRAPNLTRPGLANKLTVLLRGFGNCLTPKAGIDTQ